MATYITRTATTTNSIGHSFSSGVPNDTYTNTRWYTSFDTSTITAALADITSVKLYVNVTAITGTETYRCRTDDGTDNWGTTVDASEADFNSTDTNLESDLSLSSTGWKSFTINKNNLDLSGTTWVRLASVNESTQEVKSLTIASQNNATASNRPYLEVVSSDGILNLRTLIGVGI